MPHNYEPQRKPKIGHLLFRPNLKIRHSAENRSYYYSRLSHQDGVMDFLFTDAEIARARQRAMKNPEDCY